MKAASSARKKRAPWPVDTAFQDLETLEVLDANGRPLLVMPKESVQRQHLRHKVVLVALRDQDGKLYLHKRSRTRARQPSLWNISVSGPVLAGEARADTALRRLAEDLGIRNVPLREQAVIPPSATTDNVEVTLFLAGPTALPPSPNASVVEESMYVDQDELEALARDLPRMLTPALHLVLEVDGVFAEDKKQRAKNEKRIAKERALFQSNNAQCL